MMTSTFDPANVFLIEARDLLVQLESSLLELEARPSDRELIDTAFRALHTLKGSGAMFGPPALAAFAHHVETAFEAVRQDRIAASAAVVGVMLAATDHLRALLETPESVDLARSATLEHELEALAGGSTHAPPSAAGEPSAASPSATMTAPARWRVTLALPAQALAFGTDPCVLLDELRELGPCTVTVDESALPDIVSLEPTQLYLSWVVELETSAPRQVIEDVFIFVMDDDAVRIEACGPEDVALPLATDAIPASTAASPGPALPATSPARAATTVAPRTATKAVDAKGGDLKVADPKAGDAKAADAKADAHVRVPASRLDALLDQVGELVIAQARLTALANSRKDPLLSSVVEEIERLSAELRDSTMGMRMLPIGTLFGRYRRVVRDLSRELGKEVELTTAGEDTELDKTVIDRLSDPLVHLIRNAIDHGVESADRRVAAGKGRAGLIHLEARQSGAEVLIGIRDDGAGLNRARIREKALAAGIIAADATVADREIDQLIFHAGLSTAAAITNVSGRGVGMDVVKRTIDELRGSIDVASSPGEGTRVTLRLPLTLAIIDGLLIRIGARMCVLPLSAVEECVELQAAEHRGSSGRSFLNIRGALVPFLRLHDLFSGSEEPGAGEMVVIVSSDQGRVGLVVDQVVGHHQTVIKPLSPLHRGIAGLSGATIMGDGRVALILDIGSLIQLAQVAAALPQAA